MKTKITKQNTIRFIKDCWIALRPFSLTLALSSVCLGVVAAYRNNLLFKENVIKDVLTIILVIFAGVLAQAGANLINDYFEGSFIYHRENEKTIHFLGHNRTYFDVFIFLWGIACLGLAGLIGIYLILISNIQMLFIGLIGLLGSYAYTGKPFVYKKKGLGVPLSFILMGPLMVYGSYFPFAKAFSFYPILLSLPATLFIPALMISNEMKDFQRDKKHEITTFSILIGERASKILYGSLLALSYLLIITFVVIKIYPILSLIVLLTLPFAYRSLKSVISLKDIARKQTASLQWQFSLILIIILVIFH